MRGNWLIGGWVSPEEEAVVREAEIDFREALRKRDDALAAVQRVISEEATPANIEVHGGDLRAPTAGERRRHRVGPGVGRSPVADLVAKSYPLVAEALVQEATSR